MADNVNNNSMRNNNGGNGPESNSVNSDIKQDNKLFMTSTEGSGTTIHAPEDSIVTQVRASETNFGTTTFVDDQVVVRRDESQVAHIDSTLEDLLHSQDRTDTIYQFLQKPIVLTTGTFALTDNFTIFNSFSMPYAAVTSAKGAIWKEKLKGFFGIRMDMRFKLVVNANKFQQGRYILGWTPLGGATSTVSNLKSIKFLQAHNSTLVQRTTVPHVEIDLSTNTVAEMLIPFSSCNSFWPINSALINSDINSLGYISLYPYSPLLAPTGSATAGYTLYVSFENVSLFGAAASQGGLRKEVMNKQNGPISGVAGAVSKGFKEFGKIPLIGDYAKGVSWIADRIASTASIFGFSKPTSGDSIPKVMITNAPCHTTVDGELDCKSLSFMSAPGVVQIEGLSGNKYDEMDFSFIKSKYAWFRTVSWTVNEAVDAEITNVLNGPVAWSINPGGGVCYTPVGFLSAQFRLWRGSVKYKFKIVKTEYHSGRIQIAWYPGNSVTTVLSNSNDFAYVNRVIVDIREQNEIELVIPYISHLPWTSTAETTGVFRISVVDPLVAPSSVAPQVSILMEVSGGEDFEVAMPTSFLGTPTVLVPQSFSMDKNQMSLLSSTIGDSKVNANPTTFSSLTIGDKVSSARALLKRFSQIIRSGSDLTPDNTSIRIVPDMVLCRDNTGLATNTINADMLSVWASCYTYMSGGIRIRDNIDYGVTQSNSNQFNTSIVAFIDNEISNDASFWQISLNDQHRNINLHTALHDPNSNNTITIEVPQYTRSFSRCVTDVMCWQTTTSSTASRYTGDSSASYSKLHIRLPAGIVVLTEPNYSLHNLYRAAADDFNCSLFISIPPMLNINRSDDVNRW